MYTVRKDKFQKARGGYSRLLDVKCEHCQSHIAFYQKDGPGMLKRMYQDRFIDLHPEEKELACRVCQRILGIRIIYKKESRVAYRLFAGAITKKIINNKQLEVQGS
jgi:hypothetical protein